MLSSTKRRLGHRAALLHVASCPSCMRRLGDVLVELMDDPPTEPVMPEHEHDWALKGGIPQFCRICAVRPTEGV